MRTYGSELQSSAARSTNWWSRRKSVNDRAERTRALDGHLKKQVAWPTIVQAVQLMPLADTPFPGVKHQAGSAGLPRPHRAAVTGEKTVLRRGSSRYGLQVLPQTGYLCAAGPSLPLHGSCEPAAFFRSCQERGRTPILPGRVVGGCQLLGSMRPVADGLF